MDGGYCDKCGPAVTSKVWVDHPSGILEYCLHHANQYRAELIRQGAHLYPIRED